jgi:hypothetical protein
MKHAVYCCINIQCPASLITLYHTHARPHGSNSYTLYVFRLCHLIIVVIMVHKQAMYRKDVWEQRWSSLPFRYFPGWRIVWVQCQLGQLQLCDPLLRHGVVRLDRLDLLFVRFSFHCKLQATRIPRHLILFLDRDLKVFIIRLVPSTVSSLQEPLSVDTRSAMWLTTSKTCIRLFISAHKLSTPTVFEGNSNELDL